MGMMHWINCRNTPDIDIVLSDINMPEMDGLTLLTRLNEVSPLIKAVIVSAYGDMDNIRTAMNRGAFDFLTSPSILKTLISRWKKPSIMLHSCGKP